MPKKRIGVVIESIHGVYQDRIIHNLIEQTKDKNIDLFFFCGLGVLDIPGEYEVHECVLNLAGKPCVDGLILVLTSFTNFLGTKWVDKLVDIYKDIPKISIGFECKDVPKILLNNQKSIEKVVSYLVEEMGCRTIGYISGPLKSPEAMERYEGYQLALNDYSIEISKQFFFEGHFLERSGREAIESLLKSGQKIPDAFVCANDEMAIGASYELMENGVAIPFGVKVTGFDNTSQAAAFQVPITTIDQPMDKIINKALEFLEKSIDGEELTMDIHLVGELILRESTNDLSKIYQKIDDEDEARFSDINLIEALKSFEEKILEESARLRQLFFEDIEFGEDSETLFLEMITGIINDSKGVISKGAFKSSSLDFSKILVNRIPYSLFNQKYNKFKQVVLGLTCSSILSDRLQEIFFDTGIAINNHFYSIESKRKSLSRDTYSMSRSIMNRIMSAESIDELRTNLINVIKIHELQEFYLALYDQPVIDGHINDFLIPNTSTLFLGIYKQKIIESTEFDTTELLPSIILNTERKKQLVVLEIFRKNVHYGHLIMDIKEENSQIYETIRLALSVRIDQLS